MVSIYQDSDHIKEQVQQWQSVGLTVGLVPTMGSLHKGHLALVEQAIAHHDRVVVSIYVNPTQFAAHEDLDAYPRTLEADCNALEAYGDHVCVFAPASLYGESHSTMIVPKGVALGLEGDHRPHFFAGVATVVFRLFQTVPANHAYFGEKDYQQLAVIKQMVRDFEWPIVICSVPTVREEDGLALSSRHAYFKADEHQKAKALYREMVTCAQAIKRGMSVEEAISQARFALQKAGFGEIDYLMWCDAHQLKPVTDIQDDSRLMVAIWLGETRLIDNDSYQALCHSSVAP